ncbi:MAG: hypothetical protein GY720_00475, partial [bacterium]|nr:hypothetical protein [bacterium]
MGASALALLLLFTYLVIPGHAADAAPGDTHADDFESQDFTGTTGTLGWATSWIETGETDGETAGSIRVGAEPNCGTPSCLLLGRDSGPDATVERQVDLSGMASATLAFDYRRHRHPPGKGQVDLEVSDNGGADWYSLDSWSLGSSDATMLPASHDLTGFLAADTRIRFSVSGSTDDSHLNVDNLVITEGPAIPSGTPRMVISEFSHRGDDFVELYNAGDAAVDIDGYEVRLDGATDVTISQGGPAIVVPPGGHYLLVKPGTGLAASADQLLEAGLPSNVGIRLRDAASNLLDEVGIGSSSWSEGAPLPNQPSGTTQSYERLNGVSLGNCVDTDNNLADFVHNWGSANPQNMAAPSVPCGTPSVADHVVISEFRPEGPAGIHDEFVEIFNPTAVAVDVSGWILHITEPSLFRDYHVIPPATILDPDEHYLLSDDDGPTPNDAQPYDIATNYAAAWADVVLKDESGTIVDVLGYGSTGNGQLYEGTALPPFEPGTADRSFERRNGGSTDTDDNLADFVYAFTASPQAGIPGPNRAPVFDQDLPDRSDSEGTQIALTAGATDPDGGTTLTYAATGLPQGVSIDATTGSISGALSPNSSGTHSVAITVSDDGVPVLQDTDVFTWTVTQGEVTYLVANSGGSNGGDDLLTVVDRADADPVSNEINIGSGTGTTNIEAVALQPGTNVLFAVQDDRLGTIDVTTGVFSPRPANAGAGNGSVGLTAFNNIEGLSFNPFTGELFGTHRRGTNEEDLLFRFDPTTGAHLPGAFGGDDYIPIANQGGYYHAADLAFDPTDAQLYLVHWDLSGNWSLATVDPMSGATATKGVAPDNIVSLAFDEAGRLYTSTETGGTENLYELNKLNASVISSIVIDNGSNYEAMAIAFPVEPNRSPSFNQDLADRSDPEGTVISLSAAAGDADIGDTLSYSATGLPPGLSIDPGSGLISGTIDFLAVGTHPVTVTVSDDGIPNLDDIDTFTWTVTDLNQPPVFDQDIGDQADAEGSAVSLSAAATDPDGGDLLTYAAIGLPPGLTIDDGSGLISGTIDYSASSGSPFAVTITATDNGV